MALEDGYAFGKLVGAYSKDFSKTQAKYEKIRLTRKNMVQASSKTQGKIYHLESSIMIFFRNFFLKYLPVVQMRMEKIWSYKIDEEIKNT